MALAKFKYQAECVARKCAGHPSKGALYNSLNAAGTVPAEQGRAMRTHLQQHHGDLSAPHGRATDPSQALAPKVGPGIWFHGLPALATSTVAAADVRTRQAWQSASRVVTSQEGEAMILLSYVRMLEQQPGVYWLVPDSEVAIGALRTYQEGGHGGDGIHHLYAAIHEGKCLSPRWVINVVPTPSHWITGLNVRADAATQEPPEVDLTWLLRRPFSLLPPVTYGVQCQFSPTAPSDRLQDRASVPAQAGYEAGWGLNYVSGDGLPLDWFIRDQQRHITAHRMDNIPTMTVLANRSSHEDTVPHTTRLLRWSQPETVRHLRTCSAQSHEWEPARRQLA